MLRLRGFGLELKLRARSEAASLRLAGGEFEDDARAAIGDCSPRSDVRSDADDAQFLVKERNVDRETHEERVHGRGRPEEHALTGRKIRSAEQTPHACERCRREDAPLAHGVARLGD